MQNVNFPLPVKRLKTDLVAKHFSIQSLEINFVLLMTLFSLMNDIHT